MMFAGIRIVENPMLTKTVRVETPMPATGRWRRIKHWWNHGRGPKVEYREFPDPQVIMLDDGRVAVMHPATKAALLIEIERINALQHVRPWLREFERGMDREISTLFSEPPIA